MSYPFRQTGVFLDIIDESEVCESFLLKAWRSRKKSQNTVFRHSGESRNPVFSSSCRPSGLRFSPEWRLFTSASSLWCIRDIKRNYSSNSMEI